MFTASRRCISAFSTQNKKKENKLHTQRFSVPSKSDKAPKNQQIIDRQQQQQHRPNKYPDIQIKCKKPIKRIINKGDDGGSGEKKKKKRW